MGKVIKSQHVVYDEEQAEPGGDSGSVNKPHSALPHRLAKNVRLLRLEGEVRAIEFTCGCGERSLIELDYEAPAVELPRSKRSAT